MSEKQKSGEILSPRSKLLTGLTVAGIMALGVAAKISGVFDGTKKEPEKIVTPEVPQKNLGGSDTKNNAEAESNEAPAEIVDKPKHVRFPEDVDPEIRTEYTQVLNAVIKMVLANDEEMISAYRRSAVNYYPTLDLHASVRKQTKMPEAQIQGIKGDSVFLVMESESGEISYEIHIAAEAFQKTATLIAAVDHELRHLKKHTEGKRYDSWTEEETDVFSESIDALMKLRQNLLEHLGKENSVVRDLEIVIQKERETLEHWRSGPKRPHLRPKPMKQSPDATMQRDRAYPDKDWDVHLRNTTKGRTID